MQVPPLLEAQYWPSIPQQAPLLHQRRSYESQPNRPRASIHLIFLHAPLLLRGRDTALPQVSLKPKTELCEWSIISTVGKNGKQHNSRPSHITRCGIHEAQVVYALRRRPPTVPYGAAEQARNSWATTFRPENSDQEKERGCAVLLYGSLRPSSNLSPIHLPLYIIRSPDLSSFAFLSPPPFPIQNQIDDPKNNNSPAVISPQGLHVHAYSTGILGPVVKERGWGCAFSFGLRPCNERASFIHIPFVTISDSTV